MNIFLLRFAAWSIAFCAIWTGANLLPAPAFADNEDLDTVRYGEDALAFSSGFIRKSLPLEGLVLQVSGDSQSMPNRVLLGAGNVCFIRLAKNHQFVVGDRVTFYRRIHEVPHPMTRKLLGNLYIMAGVGTIRDISKDLASVVVVTSYGPINSGDGVMRFHPPGPPEPPVPGRSFPNIPGAIVDIPPTTTLVGSGHVVYLDWGRNDGLRVNDRLQVFRIGGALPPRTIGELKVLAIEDTTATALITSGTSPLLRGDRFLPIEPAHETAGGERTMEELERLSKGGAAGSQGMPPIQEASQPAAAEPSFAPAASEPRDLSRLTELAAQLTFEPGSAPVTEQSEPIVKEIAALLKDLRDQRIRIEGHTDNMGIGPSLKTQYRDNIALSRARAKAIVRSLVEHGVDPTELAVIGHGDTKPIASNATEEGRKKNRRIEIVLLPKTEASSALPTQISPPPSMSSAAPQSSSPTAGELAGQHALGGHEQVLPPMGHPDSPPPATPAAP